MPFEFIDNNARIDRITRKRIRRLVATGKNAGKTVSRPSKIKALREQSKRPTILSRVENRTEENTQEIISDRAVSRVDRQVGDALFFAASSDQLSPASKILAKRGE
jgi:hypothetical protein